MRYRPIVNKLAICTAIAIVPLILVGAGVTSTGAGMAFPDWPTSDSHLINPPGWMSDPLKLFEHSHRLIGWVVGMLAIGLAAAAWRSGGWVRACGLGVLFAIIVQGVLGGLRVTEISTELALVHGVWGQLCFCLACITALITSQRWAASHEELVAAHRVTLFRRSCLAATVFVFAQLVIGGVYRHFGSDWALAAHILWAIAVVFVLSWVALWALDQFPQQKMLCALGRYLAALVGVQLLLGAFSFFVVVMIKAQTGLFSWLVPSAHVVVAALILACSVVMTALSYRVLQPVVEGEEMKAAGVAIPS
jgi:cytochrome c oxidase assembly protein subunit 15